MPQPPTLTRLLTLNTENPKFPYGGLVLDVRDLSGPTDWITLKNDVVRIASTDSALNVGSLEIRVTEAARALIDGFEGELGFLPPTWNGTAPGRWGHQIALAVAVAEALGTGGHSLRCDHWSRPKDWRETLATQMARYLPEFSRAYRGLTSVSIMVDSGSFQMRMVYLPDRYWYELMAPHLEPSFVAGINEQRSYVQGGGTIAWAI